MISPRTPKSARTPSSAVAFVCSVKNKTVITAVESNRAKENVFTNIDSVVIAAPAGRILTRTSRFFAM